MTLRRVLYDMRQTWGQTNFFSGSDGNIVHEHYLILSTIKLGK